MLLPPKKGLLARSQIVISQEVGTEIKKSQEQLLGIFANIGAKSDIINVLRAFGQDVSYEDLDNG